MTETTKEQFESFHQLVANKACSLLKAKGELKNMALVGKGNDLYLIPLVDRRNGRGISGDVEIACRSIGAEYLFVFSEAWYSPDPTSKIPPSEHPDRHEVLIISSEHLVYGQGLIQYKILRKANGKIDKLVLDGMKFDSVGGNLTHLLTGGDGTNEPLDIRKQPGYKSHFKSPGYTVH